MADIEVVFNGDDGPLRRVIGRLDKDIITFAKRAEAAFGSVQDQLRALGRSGGASEDAFKRQAQQLERLQKASNIKAPTTSGFNDSQVRKIQAGLAESVAEARKLNQEFSELSGPQQRSVNFLKQQVTQYDRALERQRQINQLAKERSSSIQAGGQSTQGPTTSTGLTEEQVRKVQAALANSVTQARELTQEFIKQNAGVSDSTDLVRRQGAELEKVSGTSKEVALANKRQSTELAKIEKSSKSIVVYSEKFAKDQLRAANATKEVGSETEKTNKRVSRLQKLLKNLGSNDLPSLRYALYDVSNSLRRIAIGATAAATVPVGLSIAYEREFANVIRTNELAGEKSAELREQIKSDLLAIAQLTPISWEDVTNIAALAGQLGIAADTIGSFTETVAKFSATTDLTVDAAATGFGRLNQLLDGVDGKFENLGSAILAVGVDSVATESQIVNVSTQIASMGNLAGLTAPEVIGLSGAIASLGIRPELARGNVTRLFSTIGRSAVEGGFQVQEFGRLTGRTADQFVDDWSTDPGAVLQDFFRGINEEGPEAERTLRSLGITSVRDIPAILRLAQNNQEVSRLIALSNEEYLQANKVSEQYGIISGTTAEQLARLGQNFQTLGATIGDSVGPLALLIQFLNNAVQGFTKLAQTGFGQFLSGVVIVLGLLVGAFAAVATVLAGAAAGFIALKFASRELGITLNRDTLRAIAGGKTAIDALGISGTKAAAAIRVLSFTLRTLGIVSVILGVVTAVAAAFGSWGDDVEKTESKVNKFFGGLEGLTDAIEKDTAAFDENTKKMKDGTEALATFEQTTTGVATELTDAQKRASEFADTLEVVEEKAKDADNAVRTLAVGPETFDLVQGKFLEQADIIEAFGDPAIQQAFLNAGGNINELLEAGIAGEAGGLLDGLIANLRAESDGLAQEIAEITGQLTTFGTPGGISAEEFETLTQRQRELQQQQLSNTDTIKILDGATRDFLDTTGEGIDLVVKQGEGTGFFTEQMGGLAGETILADKALQDINKTLFAQANYVKSVEDSFADYAKGIRDGEEDVDAATGALGNLLDAINQEPNKDAGVILANYGVIMRFLEDQGLLSAGAQAMLAQAIAIVGAAANLSEDEIAALVSAESGLATINIAGLGDVFSSAMADIGSSAGGAAKEVKTLAEEFEELLDTIFEPVNAAQDQAEAIADLGKSYGELGDSAFFASDEIQDAISGITDSADSPEQAVANLEALFGELARTVGSDTDPSLQFLRNTINRVAAEFGIAASEVADFANVDLSFFQAGVESVQQEVRTLLDYAGELDEVISRAFDIRYADILQIDNIADAWQDLSERINEATESIEELKASQKDLSADRAIKEYFLSVAESYGDMLRAAQLRDEIAELDREQAENAQELRQQQLIAGGDLTGDEPASRESRSALLDLVQEYQQYIVTLAESGASQDELREATAKARAEFVEQARELGFQEEVVLEYAQAFDDVTVAINNVPRDITVDANVNPALQALNELNAKLEDSIDLAEKLNRVTGGTGGGDGGNNQRSGTGEPTRAEKIAEGKRLSDQRYEVQAKRASISLDRATLNFGDRLPIGYSEGGFTGRGGKFDPAGIVHKGEFVVPKQYVNQSTGLPDPSFLAQLQNGLRGFAQGGFVGATGGGTSDSVMMVELSPYDRKLLSDAGNVQLRLNGRVVAEATNDSNRNQARRGAS